MNKTKNTITLNYRPVTSDLADQSMSFGDVKSVELKNIEHTPSGEYSGEHIRATALDGRDIVVFLSSGRVRARDGDSGSFNQFLGYVEKSIGWFDE